MLDDSDSEEKSSGRESASVALGKGQEYPEFVELKRCTQRNKRKGAEFHCIAYDQPELFV